MSDKRRVSHGIGDYYGLESGEADLVEVIQALQQQLASAREHGWETVKLCLHYCYEEFHCSFQGERDETEAEARQRLAEEQAHQQRAKESFLGSLSKHAQIYTKEELLAAWENGQKKGNKP